MKKTSQTVRVRPAFFDRRAIARVTEPLGDLPLWTRPAGFAYLGRGPEHTTGLLARRTEMARCPESEKIYDGGQSIVVHADLYRIPLSVRIGSRVEVGDLNQEWRESVEVAHPAPDLKALDAGVRAVVR
jgi:hypothetical protein